ncbi:MAG TPA: DUF2268 domain-containing putative Zn-dependent protease [Bacteroidales bacterium]|nr:DUF2268 domain-containing putative Zn-dependent protease [Bacteroidales bacterium]
MSHSGKFNGNIVKSSDKYIYKPIRDEILDDAEAAFLFNTIKVPYETNDYLRNEIQLLKSSDLLTIIQESFTKITKELPGPDTKIIILPASSLNRPALEKIKLPISGITLGSGKIILSIDPTFQNWTDFLPYCIAHEYHHSTWCSRNWISADFSLIEYLVFEGRADLFASEQYKTVSNPLTNFLTREQETEVWELIKNEIFGKGHDRINGVMFGTDKIPFGSGYNIGFNIVRLFKERNPATNTLDLMDMNPNEIFERSGYEDYKAQK